MGPFALEGSPPRYEGAADGYAPRRYVLDSILVDAAAAAGVEVRQHFVVDEVLTENERVTGLRGHAAGGATAVEHAPIVIGADGMRSLVARTVDAKSYQATPSLTCAYYTYWERFPARWSGAVSTPRATADGDQGYQ